MTKLPQDTESRLKDFIKARFGEEYIETHPYNELYDFLAQELEAREKQVRRKTDSALKRVIRILTIKGTARNNYEYLRAADIVKMFLIPTPITNSSKQ